MNDQPPPRFSVTLLSFGFKHGLPGEINLLFDARFLPNPYYEETLRDQTGLDSAAAAFALDHPAGREFLQNLQRLLTFLFGEFQKAGKEGLTIAIGCTGGRHRSVAVVEALRRRFAEQGRPVMTRHRDIDK